MDKITEKHNRIKEIEAEVEALYLEKNELEKSLLRHEIDPKIDRILNKWVKIPGWGPIDEHNGFRNFRLAKVVGIDSWQGNTRFKLKLKHLVYIGLKNSGNPYNDTKFELLFTNKQDQMENTVNDIDSIVVLKPSMARTIVRNAHKTVTGELEKIAKAIINDL